MAPIICLQEMIGVRRDRQTKTTVQVNIAGRETNCLMDTSHISTPVLLWRTSCRSDQSNDLLEVEVACYQSVPYLWYIELTITFSKEFVCSYIEIYTLALAISHLHSASHEQALINTHSMSSILTTRSSHPFSLYWIDIRQFWKHLRYEKET